MLETDKVTYSIYALISNIAREHSPKQEQYPVMPASFVHMLSFFLLQRFKVLVVPLDWLELL